MNTKQKLEEQPFICEVHRIIGQKLDFIIQGLFMSSKKQLIPTGMWNVVAEIAKEGEEIPKLILEANSMALDMENGLERRREFMKMKGIEGEYQEWKTLTKQERYYKIINSKTTK